MPPRQESLHTPLHEPLDGPELPDFSNMTDAELERFVAGQEEGSRLDVPLGLAPPGMTYQWVRVETYGKPDYARQAEVEARGWKAVPQRRHDGRWMKPGTEGPTVIEGLMLYECPTRLYEAKQRFDQRKSREPTESMIDRLSYTPPGSAPRDAHPKTRPSVRRETVQVEFAVEK
jgi:hypothetical protein